MDEKKEKIYLETAIFDNVAPFDMPYPIKFEENEIAVFTGINGKGKTTILSYIVDAFHEMAKMGFSNEFEDKQNKFYRISSPIFNLDSNKPSFVYLRFKFADKNIDYLNVSGLCTKEYYNEKILLKDKIEFEKFSKKLEENKCDKIVSIVSSESKEIFDNNILTYFPSYRYEQPSYLNDPYSIKLNFDKSSAFAGYLPNPIEIVSNLHTIANWIMDVALDKLNYKQNYPCFNGINKIIENIIEHKKITNKTNLRIAIGDRHDSGIRIQIVEDVINNEERKETITVVPSIFCLSSGQLALLCLFGELLRQSDKNRTEVFQNMTGIVVIDEIDKHLHIKLQKEILPGLLALFPNIQFITSSHSPFLSLGLAQDEGTKNRAKIKCLDSGQDVQPQDIEEYKTVYGMIIKEHEDFRERFLILENKIKANETPLIITEGKTDWKYYLKALRYFHNKEEFLVIKEEYFLKYGSQEDTENKVCNTDIFLEMGDETLNKFLESLKNSREIDTNSPRTLRIGLFDSDNKNIKTIDNLSYGVISFKLLECGISTEFLFTEEEIKQEIEGKRLYIGTEFNVNTKKLESDKTINIGGGNNNQNKVGKRTIIDEKIYGESDESLALSKNDFANAIFNDKIQIADTSWENFREIFQKIEQILKTNNNITNV